MFRFVRRRPQDVKKILRRNNVHPSINIIKNPDLIISNTV